MKVKDLIKVIHYGGYGEIVKIIDSETREAYCQTAVCKTFIPKDLKPLLNFKVVGLETHRDVIIIYVEE
jgi:hypothetical protein